MILTSVDWWIIAIGALCAAACALPGSILVLRRMSLMGDAISHTVLPGIAIAFLVSGSRDPAAMLIGAIIVGVLTAILVQAIHSLGNVEVGASIGIVFTVLFAFGLVLMRQAIDHVDIDPDCVLYGSIEFSIFDQVNFLGLMYVPRAIVINGIMFIANAILIAVFYKEFKISSFDPGLAKSQGFRPEWMHYLLMTMTAATAVAAFESVGSILVVAMFIVPPATAYLLTDRYGVLLLLSVLIGFAAAFFGHLSAITIPTWFGFSGTVTSGAMAVAAGGLFVIAWICSPKHGLLSKGYNRLVVKLKIMREDVLGVLWRLEERNRYAMASGHLSQAIDANPVLLQYVLRKLNGAGNIQHVKGEWELTDVGRKRATSIIRTHRLWEVYLDKHFPQDKHQLHHAASRLEHVTTDEMQSALGDATHDPHGSKVPPPIDEDEPK